MGKDTLHSYPIDEGKRYVIGRASSCDIRFEESKLISRIHGVIDVRRDGVYYTDKSSTNGSELEGVSLASGRAVKLKYGQTIVLGKTPISIILKDKLRDSAVGEAMKRKSKKIRPKP